MKKKLLAILAIIVTLGYQCLLSFGVFKISFIAIYIFQIPIVSVLGMVASYLVVQSFFKSHSTAIAKHSMAIAFLLSMAYVLSKGEVTDLLFGLFHAIVFTLLGLSFPYIVNAKKAECNSEKPENEIEDENE